MLDQIQGDWKNILQKQSQEFYFQRLTVFIEKSYLKQNIFPAKQNIFEAFSLCTFENTKVILLGQDPYHGKNQAHGLAFSVPKNTPLPPSLKNIFKALAIDLGGNPRTCGDLSSWAKQGVLLLNTCLTVVENQAFSHQNQGWEIFTDFVIQYLSQHKEKLVFLLWGKPAQSKKKMIHAQKHLILEAPHPSPLSAYRGFLTCKHFSQTNAFLVQNHLPAIDWHLENRV